MALTPPEETRQAEEPRGYVLSAAASRASGLTGWWGDHTGPLCTLGGTLLATPGPDTKPGACLTVYVHVFSVLIMLIAGFFVVAIVFRWVLFLLPCGRRGLGRALVPPLPLLPSPTCFHSGCSSS